ncbi:Pentatricopeptide repeat-containing protein, mitochondrial, partial [Mucuna pruriens]
MRGVSRRVQQILGPKPHKDSFYYTHLLHLCKTTGSIKKAHAQVVVGGHEQDPFLAAKLIDNYAHLRGSSNLECARKVFDNLSEPDVFCWNVVIKGYANVGPFGEALKVYDAMRWSGTTPNRYTYPFVLKACGAEGASQKGQVIHGHAVKCGLDLDLFVGNALVTFYAKCQDIEMSRKVFDEIPHRDIVSWNSMISGYTVNGYVDDAIMLFYGMLRDEGVGGLDHATLVTVLPAFAQVADIHAGYWIHCYIVKTGMGLDSAVGSGLISLYSNCGYVSMARAIFDKIADRNIVLWNAIIRCYGTHGLAQEALSLFQQLVEAGLHPDGIIHAGLLEQGWHLFHTMETYGVAKSEAHYACIVDLLGRAGDLEKAVEFIQSMPIQPGKNVYGALLGACRIHKNIELAELAAEKLFVLDPYNAGRYVILAQMYEDAGRWQDAARVRKVVKEKEIKKPIGYSSVELESGHQKFGVNDETHLYTTQIFQTLLSLDRVMGKETHRQCNALL